MGRRKTHDRKHRAYDEIQSKQAEKQKALKKTKKKTIHSQRSTQKKQYTQKKAP